MKSFRIICFFLMSGLVSLAQVTVQTNLPASLAPNTNILFEVKINKGSITNFSKYQIDVPAGVIMSEGDTRTGNFTFEDNRAKIVWVSIPSEPEFVVTFKMNTGGASGATVFNQKFFYLDNGSKKEVEFDPINVNFDASGATSVASLGGTAGNATASTEPKGSVTTSSSEPTNTTASNTASETPVANVETKTTTPVETKTTPTETKSTNTEPVTSNTTPAETKTTPVETKKTEPVNNNTSSNTTPVTVAKTTNTAGMIYKVQLSASTTDPGKAKFASAGKVVVSNEDGMYKVLVGNFNSKEEAIEKMNQLKASGFNGFVVKYLNGVRVK